MKFLIKILSFYDDELYKRAYGSLSNREIIRLEGFPSLDQIDDTLEISIEKILTEKN